MIWQYSLVLLVALGWAQPNELEQSSLQSQLEVIAGNVPVPESHPSVKEAVQEYIIGRQFAAQDKHVLAIEHFQLSVELDDKATASWVGLAVSIAAIGRSENAIRVWREVIKRDPSHGDALLILGLDAARVADYQLAQKYLALRWLQKEDEPVEALLRDAALIAVSQSLNSDVTTKLQASFPPILEAAVIALVHGASAETWLGVMQQLIDVNATSVALELVVASAPQVKDRELAVLLSALPVLEVSSGGDGSLTKEIYGKVANSNGLPLSPRWFKPMTHAEALYTAGLWMSMLGASDAPIELYEASIKLDPENALTVNNLAWLRLLRDGATPYVEELCARAIELDSHDSFIQDTVGWMFVLQGKPEKGIPLFIEALSHRNQPSPETYEHLGDAYWILGQEGSALRSWQTAATLIHATEIRKRMLEYYASLQHSQWGISVATPEALYDHALGQVARRLKKKLAAVENGEDPQVEAVTNTNGEK